MKAKFSTQLTLFLLILTLAFSAYAAPAEGEALTAGALADYLISAADDYNPNAVRAKVMEGFSQDERASRLTLLVMASRAFGELPAPSGNGKNLTPPAADLKHIPGWARAALQNLSDGGLLAASDVENERLNAPVQKKDAEIIAQRFYQAFGTNLKDHFYAAVNKTEMNSLAAPQDGSATGGSSDVSANTDRQLHELILEIVNSKDDYLKGSAEQKIRDLYNSVLAVKAGGAAGIQPLKKYLDAADKASTFSELNAAIAMAVNDLGNTANGLFPMIAMTDTKDGTKKVMQLMTLYPMFFSSEYDDPNHEEINQYRADMVEKLMAAGESREAAELHANGLLAMEKTLAQSASSDETLSSLQAQTKRYTPKSLDEMMPGAKPSELFWLSD